MKILYNDPDTGYMRKRKVGKLTLNDLGIIFKSDKSYFVAKVPEGKTVTDMKKLLLPCTIDLTELEIVKYDKKYLKELERIVDLDMINYMANNRERLGIDVDSIMDQTTLLCLSADLKDFYKWSFPDILAEDIDQTLGCSDFTDIVRNSLWFKVSK